VIALEALQAPPRFILVCHSFGGALASYFLHLYPQRVTALVLIASAVCFRLRLAGRLLLRVPPALLTWMREILPYVGFNADRVYPPAHVVYLQNKNGLRTWDGSDYLRAIKVPTLVILGQRDILFSDASYKEVARQIPGAEQVVIPVSAHQKTRQSFCARPDRHAHQTGRARVAGAAEYAALDHRVLRHIENRRSRRIVRCDRGA
jgi:long-chain acyl-CoA synthetase